MLEKCLWLVGWLVEFLKFSFNRAEQLAITQDLEAKKSTNPKQKSGGTLKRKDTKSTTPKKKQYQAADQLDETSFRKFETLRPF